jgi:hypothetical protein
MCSHDLLQDFVIAKCEKLLVQVQSVSDLNELHKLAPGWKDYAESLIKLASLQDKSLIDIVNLISTEVAMWGNTLRS